MSVKTEQEDGNEHYNAYDLDSIYLANFVKSEPQVKIKIKPEFIYKNIPSPKKYKCSKCVYNTNHKDNLKIHFYRKHEKPYYHCSQCNYKTTSKLYFQKHPKRHETEMQEKIWYHCEKCDYKSNWKAHLKRHMSVHEEQSISVAREKILRYQCEKCDYKTEWK